MDKTSLVADDVEQGRRFVEALRAAGLPIAVAMWFRKAISSRWLLGIASPDVQTHGTLPVIRLSEAVRRTQKAFWISRDDLFVFNTSGSFMQDIDRFPARVGREPATVDSFNLNGVDIERAFVFWIDRAAVASQTLPLLATQAS